MLKLIGDFENRISVHKKIIDAFMEDVEHLCIIHSKEEVEFRGTEKQANEYFSKLILFNSQFIQQNSERKIPLRIIEKEK